MKKTVKRKETIINSLKSLFVQTQSGKKVFYWLFLVIVIVFHIFTSLKTVSHGGKISQLEKEKELYKNKNRALSSKLIETSSLIKLREESGNLGFVVPSRTLYINKEDSFASLP